MSPRLLYLLSTVESALINLGCKGVQRSPQRAVNFDKGIARMNFEDGSGSITLQNFTLADGEICVRAEYYWAQSNKLGSFSIYPTQESFDWSGAAAKIAEAWMTGDQAQLTPESKERTLMDPGMERYVAAV